MKPPKLPLRLHEDAEMLVSKKGEKLIAGPRHPVAFQIHTLGLLEELLVKPEHNTRHMKYKSINKMNTQPIQHELLPTLYKTAKILHCPKPLKYFCFQTKPSTR